MCFGQKKVIFRICRQNLTQQEKLAHIRLSHLFDQFEATGNLSCADRLAK
jgi:hypothetical protein